MLSVFLILISIFLVFICLWLLHIGKKKLEMFEFSISKVEVADRENMAFLLLYLTPLLKVQFDDSSWPIWVITIAIFALVVATGYGYHFNPLLGLFGWHFYKVGTKEEVTYVLITKRQLRSTIRKMKAVQLTEYIIMDIEDRNGRE